MADSALVNLLSRPRASVGIKSSNLMADLLQRSTPSSDAPTSVVSLTPVPPIDPATAADELSLAKLLAQIPDLLTAGLIAARLTPPLNAKAHTIRGTYTDVAAQSGATSHLLATATIPKGQRFLVRRRLSILDTTAGAVRGGITIIRNSSNVYDGASAMDGVVATEAGEYLGATGLDLEWFTSFEPSDVITMTANLIRGLTAVSCNVHGSIIGYLVPVQ